MLATRNPFVLLVLTVCGLCFGLIEECAVPPELEDCLRGLARKTTLNETVGHMIDWWCTQHYRLAHNFRSLNSSAEVCEAAGQYEAFRPWVPAHRRKRQATLRVRKEYRQLSEQERRDYHRAVQMLKDDLSATPNRYDSIAGLHELNRMRAHDGPAFLGWHRMYLLIYEDALREKVPTVTIPYWDCTLDDVMRDPTRSVVWTHRFMGNGDGLVTSGPFANWITPVGPLTRNVGVVGDLVNSKEVENVLSRRIHSDIVFPTARPRFNWEFIHGQQHIWVGGTMTALETAAYDPLFFMVHAFVDYVWERFRENQIQYGIDPSQDYPRVFGHPLHAADALSKFASFTNEELFGNFFTSSVYTYDRSPTCSRRSPQCGSRYLVCNTGLNPPMCESSDSSRSSYRRRRSVYNYKSDIPVKSPFQTVLTEWVSPSSCSNTCPANTMGQVTQNTYCANDNADMREWVYIPVNIIHKRSFAYTPDNPRAIFNDKPYSLNVDIYNPYMYADTRSSMARDHLASYSTCEPKSTADKVFVVSTGKNYMGYYQTHAVVDSRYPVSRATAYVAVKKPTTSDTEVLISAFDTCGHLCRPYCQCPGTSPPTYRPCSQALRVTSASPKMYGIHIGDALTQVWDFQTDGKAPQFNNENVFLTFVCAHDDTWPGQHAKTGNTSK